jgi:hypothetical protein
MTNKNGYIIQTYRRNIEGFASRLLEYAGLYAICLETQKTPAIIKHIEDDNRFIAFNWFNDNALPFKLTIQETFPNIRIKFKILEHNTKLQFETITINSGELPCDQHYSLKELSHKILPQKSYNIHGRFGFCTFWHKYTDKIIELLQFDTTLLKHCRTLLPYTDKKKVGVCMRYEYKYSSHASHQVKLTQKYYKEAILQFDPAKCIFVIFSDMPEHNEVFFKGLPARFETVFLPKLSSSSGLCALSLCDHIINANSTFSIMASILCKNPHKQIVCPKYYFNPTTCNFYNCNYYPDTWLPIG